MESSNIVQASLAGHTAKVLALLESGVSANACPEGCVWPPLVSASYNGHIDTIKVLLDHGAKVDLQDNEQWTALIRACRMGHIKTVKLLLERGASVDVKTNCGATALYVASSNGHPEIVEILLDHGAEIDAKDDLGFTPLISAVTLKFTEIVKILVKHGAQVNWKTPRGWTCLILACELGQTEVAQLLLEHGAEVDSQDELGRSAIHHVALSDDDGATTKLLLDHKAQVDHLTNDGETALILASLGGRTKIVRVLLDNGARVEHHDDKDCCALFVACMHGHTATARLLLKRGADPNCRQCVKKEMNSILNVICCQPEAQVNNPATARALLEHGARVDTTASKRCCESTALHHACMTNSNETVKVLLEYDADVDAQMSGSGQSSPLNLAISNDNIEAINILLEHGAKVDFPQLSFTPLSEAVSKGKVEIVKILLANLVKNQESLGRSTLMDVSRTKNAEIRDLFVQHGFNVSPLEAVLGSTAAKDMEELKRLLPAIAVGLTLPQSSDKQAEKKEVLKETLQKLNDLMLKLPSTAIQPSKSPSVLSSPLSSPNKPTLRNVLGELICQEIEWQNIGVLLDIPSTRLKSIQSEYVRPRDCLREMVLEWLKSDPTWEQLVEAVEPIDPKIAESIYRQYCKQK